MHHLTVKNIYPCAGQPRLTATDQVRIDADFVPAEPYDVRMRLPDLLNRATNWQAAADSMPLKSSNWPILSDTRRIQVAADLFYEFVTIHPFRGGNGRVGRAFLNLLLYEMEILQPPEQIFSAMARRRGVYMDVLRRADAGDFEPLHGFVIRSVLEVRFELLLESLLEVEGVRRMLSRDLYQFLILDKRNYLGDASYQKRLARLWPRLRKIVDQLASR